MLEPGCRCGYAALAPRNADAQVHAEDPVPLLDRVVGGLARCGHAGVEDQGGQTVTGRGGRAEGRLEDGRVADVADHPGVAGPELAHRRLDRDVEVDADDDEAVAGEPLGDGACPDRERRP